MEAPDPGQGNDVAGAGRLDGAGNRRVAAE
jgi:hypothetical protein